MASMDDREQEVTQDKPETMNESASEASSGETDASHEQRGFAAMSAEKQREIAGGVAVSTNKRHMSEIGRRGGERVSRDRAHMARIGRKGGEAVSGDRAHMAQIGRKGGEARGESR
jgi:uncharacterized protein